ncbi:hypothetical protein SAMN02745704_01686 [Paucidesulfovibrio gracilis DSM 16080]|uniref:Uncharacterized protein n=1 Tax=Paucidesulfovibrio gracilis DSM 16080 TaxID=1121449 RepID=A0A1T4X389_9BACT|nr:hypothetical protein [Paucidesulfovibrio gracilis]SKA83628.1 hypothetical protein SAMN02745704_01686 [Paucidesulfovibrio gracilis DSM 16080]
MNDTKYSILFMRDDLDVRRFRLNPFWLKALVFTLVMLVVLASGGIYFGATALLDNLALKRENTELARRLKEAELRLTTLENMEKILESYDSSDLQSLLQNPEATTDTAADADDQTPDINLSELFPRVDTGSVRLEDMRLNLGPKQLQVNFNLLNNLNNTLLSGDTELALVTNDGRVVPLETQGTDLSFQIQRRKPMRARISLPDAVEADSVYGVRLTVKREDGKVIFSETYPQHRLD